jgi:hypothetical protein
VRLARLDRPLAWAAIAALLALTAVVLERRVSWYLSVDQFGYLAFADDLLHGRVFHPWPPARALATVLESPTDMLSQTYVYDHGRLSSRYAPGFPLLLAAWKGVFGHDVALYLNLVLFLALLGVLVAFEARLAPLSWSAAVLGLAILSPSSISLWATTLSRDVAAHLSAFAGLLLLLPPAAGDRGLGARAAGGAAALLGFAASIRPDAILYVVPALALLVWRRRREPARASMRAICVAALVGLLVGLAPSLAYNAVATGNPFRPTQGMELEHFLAGVVAPRAAHAAEGWHGTTHIQVSGNALRLVHIARVLPENLLLLWEAHGAALSLLALWGVIVAVLRRSPLAPVAIAYGPLAILFYSCWARAEIRYLFGVALLVPLLVVEGALGTLDLVQRLSDRGRIGAARALAAAAALGGAALALFAPLPAVPTSALHGLARLVPGTLAVGALVLLVVPQSRPVAVLGPFLALALTGVTAAMAWPGLAFRAPFQGAEMRRARATFTARVPDGAVVISTEDIGRPVENIEHYTGAHALYLTDLQRWHLSVAAAARLFLYAQMPTYLLLPDGPDVERILFGELGDFAAHLVADVAPEHARDWFVVSHYHNGIPLKVYRIDAPPVMQR